MRRRRWQRAEAGPESLHASAFLVDGDDQRRGSHGMDVRHETGELGRIGVVAREQDDAAHERMAQHLAVLGRQLETADIDHQWSKSHNLFPVEHSYRFHVCGVREHIKDPRGA